MSFKLTIQLKSRRQIKISIIQLSCTFIILIEQSTVAQQQYWPVYRYHIEIKSAFKVKFSDQSMFK